MQDRFKFRFFDKRTKKMMYEDSDFSAYRLEEWCDYEEKMAITALETILNYPKHYILMQSTGLKDKNGKLIYEGDIIKICCCNLRKTQISDVFFCSERSAFCFHYKTDYGNFANCTMEKTEIEVIGNKFENPELLKECEDE